MAAWPLSEFRRSEATEPLLRLATSGLAATHFVGTDDACRAVTGPPSLFVENLGD